MSTSRLATPFLAVILVACQGPAATETPAALVRWGTRGHTNELVSVYAKGAHAARIRAYEGTWYPGTRIVDQTQLHRAMREALGLR